MYTPLAPNSLIAGQYRIIKAVGQGGSGSIYLAEDTRTFNRRCIVKRLITGQNPDSKTRFAEEVQMITRLRHPNVAQVYAFFEDGINSYIIMEYIAGRDLDYNLSQMREDGSLLPGRAYNIEQVIRDGMLICDILQHLHSRTPPVIHCDIKPANLIRDAESMSLFLVDFGAAASSNYGENYGTPGYAAPEMYRSHRSPASDIYALGATLYHLATDDDPTTHPLKFPKIEQLPGVFRTLIKACLTEEPSQRPSAHQVRSQLENMLKLPLADKALATPQGVAIHNTTQLAEAIQAEWSWGLTQLNNGKLQAWLSDNGLFTHLQWLNTSRLSLQPDELLHHFIRRLHANLAPVTIRVDKQLLEVKPGSYTKLSIRAVGGPAQVSIQHAPYWMQYSPKSINLVPNTVEAFNICLDPGVDPSILYQGTFTLTAYTQTKKPTTTKIKIRSLWAPSQPHLSNRPTQTNNADLSLVTTLITTIGIVLLFVLSINHMAIYFAEIIAALLIGSVVASYKTSWSDRILVVGLALLGGIVGAYIVPIFVYSMIHPVLTLLLACGGASLGAVLMDAITIF